MRLSAARLALAAVVLYGRPAMGQAATSAPSLVLNHLVIVLDSATFRDIRNSSFIRDGFAAFDSSMFASAGFHGTVRLFGKYNYLAFVNSGAHAAGQAGDVGIVLGTDVPGGFEAIMAHDPALKRMSRVPPGSMNSAGGGQYGKSFASLLDLAESVRLTGSDSTSDHARFEIVQYPDDLARLLAATDSLPLNDRTAARFLAPVYDPHRLMEYVSGATLAIPVDDIARIVAVLRRHHVNVLDEGEGAIIHLSGMTLHLLPPWTGPGVKQLQFALTRDVPANPVYRFGPRSQLRFGPGPIAVWDFGIL